jgi:hypothetical protein
MQSRRFRHTPAQKCSNSIFACTSEQGICTCFVNVLDANLLSIIRCMSHGATGCRLISDESRNTTGQLALIIARTRFILPT